MIVQTSVYVPCFPNIHPLQLITPQDIDIMHMCAWVGLNHRPQRYKRCALTPELQAHSFILLTSRLSQRYIPLAGLTPEPQAPTLFDSSTIAESPAYFKMFDEVQFLCYTQQRMDRQKVAKLIKIAKKRMSRSKDPVHDLAHARRVVKYARKFTQHANLSQEDKMAVELACWWHDVGRTVIKRPSIVIMSFIDDTISAYMLLKEAILMKGFCKPVRKAIMLVLCNNTGTGPIITKLFLNQHDRKLLNFVNDADNFDLFNYHRMNRIMKMAKHSFIFHHGYKLTAWWFFELEKIKFRTQEARQYFQEVLRQLADWMMQDHIKKWHIDTFGWEWCEKTLLRIHALTKKYA